MENSQQDQISDYDAEWDREDAPEDDQGVVTDGSQPTDDEDPAFSETAPDTTGEETPSDDPDAAAEQTTDSDTKADDTGDQEALRQAETKIMSLEGQLKALNDRLAIRGRELKELRRENSDLKKASQEPTEFEKEFPQFAGDIRKIAGLEEPETETDTDPVDEMAATVDAILAAHPDAGAIHESREFHEYLATSPTFIFEGTPMFVNNAVNSDNADEVNAALTHYKSTLNTPDPTPDTQKETLEDMVPPPTSKGKPDIPSSAPKTTQEEYDAEWARDDD